MLTIIARSITKNHGLLSLFQGGGRSWQDFGEGKNDHKMDKNILCTKLLHIGERMNAYAQHWCTVPNLVEPVLANIK